MREFIAGMSVSNSRKQPLVSVIMNCLNCSEYLSDAIDSVYDQTYDNWEIILLDNNSDDDILAIVNRYDNKIKYFKTSKIEKLGKARNIALEKSKGEYLAFLDCDDLWLPSKIEKQVALFENNKKLGLVFCDTIFFDNGGDRKQLYGNKKPAKGKVFNELLLNYFLSMETVTLSRKVLDELDEWFDVRLEVTEEKELFLRVSAISEVDYIDETLAKWRVDPNSWTHKRFDLFATENQLIYDKFIKLYPDLNSGGQGLLRAFREKIVWQEALNFWKIGDGFKCRLMLKPLLKSGNLKIHIVYILSYSGPRFFNFFMSLYLRFNKY